MSMLHRARQATTSLLSSGMMKRSYASIAVNKQEMVDLCVGMVKFDTQNPPGNEKPCAEYLAEWGARHGLEAEVVDIEGRPNRSNVVLAVRSSRPDHKKSKSLLYTGHTDVVPIGTGWSVDPFGGEIKDGKIYGRGTADMKGGIAAMLVAMSAIQEAQVDLPGDLIFVGTADEEYDEMFGAEEFAKNHKDAKNIGAVVISEPTDMDLFISHRGAVNCRLVTKGRSCHSSVPHLGTNAIIHMSKALLALNEMPFTFEKHELLGNQTFSAGIINGGTRATIVPDRCECHLDMRIVPGQTGTSVVNDIHAAMDKIKAETPDFDFEIILDGARVAMETKPDDPSVLSLQASAEKILGSRPPAQGAPYYTDGGIMQPYLQCPIMIIGPGQLDQAHIVDESIHISEMERAADLYADYAIRYFEQE